MSLLPVWVANALNGGFDNAKPPKTVITFWDSQKADEQLKALYKKHGKKYLPACKEFITKEYLGIIIDGIVGKVQITEYDRDKLVNDLIPYKALAIARIPEILLSGKVLPTSQLNKTRTKDNYSKFLVVQKDLTFVRGNGDVGKVRATLKIGVSGNDNFAYNLAIKKQAKSQPSLTGIPNKKKTSSGFRSYNGLPTNIKSQFDRLVNTDTALAVTLLELTVVE